MELILWQPGGRGGDQLEALCAKVRVPGVVVVKFDSDAAGEPWVWSKLERWTRSRAVTVADIAGRLSGGALELALSSDLVYVRESAVLEFPTPEAAPSAGLVWVLGRAGRPARARLLLDGGAIGAVDAVELGLAHARLLESEELPLLRPRSLVAMTAARDLSRARATGSAALGLELATFRLMFATGHPAEGARAFLERREPAFGGRQGGEEGE